MWLFTFNKFQQSFHLILTEPKDDFAYRFLQDWIGETMFPVCYIKSLLNPVASFIALFITLTRKRVIGDRGPEVVSTQTTLDPRVPL